MIRLRWALWVLIVIQGVAVFWLMQPWATGDSFAYLRDAESMRHLRFGEATPTGFVPDGIHPPGYPLLLFLFLHVLHLPLGAVVFLQLLMFFAAVWLCARILAEPRLEVIFLGFVVLYPAAVAYSTRALSEGPALLVLCGAVFLLARQQITVRASLFAGGALGFLALLRPDAALLPFFMGFFLRSRRNALALIAAAGAVLLPYALRNAVVFSNPLPIPPHGALPYSIYLATWETKLGAADFAAIQQGNTPPAAIATGFAAEAARLNAAIGAPVDTPPLGPGAYPSELRPQAAAVIKRAALERIANDPGDYAKHSALAFWRIFNAQNVPGPRIVALGLRTLAGIAWALGMAGLALLWRDSRTRLLVAPVLYMIGIHIWLHTEARYTATVRLFLLCSAAVALHALARAFVAERPTSSGMKSQVASAGVAGAER